MPAKSKSQQRFMGIVHAIQKGDAKASDYSDEIQTAAKNMKKKDVNDFADTNRKSLPDKVKTEDKKRDYKAEYKKFQSSDKSKKYRAELNKYNRQKGTYGNGDGKDASHKGGKIVGFEKESTNRGRAEKSRLKKESMNEDNFRSRAIDDMDDIHYNVKDLAAKLAKEDKRYGTRATKGYIKLYKQHYLKFHYGVIRSAFNLLADEVNPTPVNEATKVNVDKLLKHPKIKSLLNKLSITGTKSKEDVIKILNYFGKNPSALSALGNLTESAVSFWQDMFRPGPIPKKYINQLIKKKGELPSKSHIKRIYKDNGNPSSSELSKTWKQLQKEKYVRAASGMWRWNSDFTGWEEGKLTEGFDKYYLSSLLDSKLKKKLEIAIKNLKGKIDGVGDDYIWFRMPSGNIKTLAQLIQRLDKNKNVWIGDKRKNNIWDRRRNVDKLDDSTESNSSNQFLLSIDSVNETIGGQTDTIKEFILLCQKELGIKNIPNIILTDNRELISGGGCKTAQYENVNNKVVVWVEGRALVDVLRSVAHELVHHKQYENNELVGDIPNVGGPIEDEANASAGSLIKMYSIKNPISEAINTAKASEIRKKLLKRFGKDPLYKDFIIAKTPKEQKKALDTLKSIRGSNAIRLMQKYTKSLAESDFPTTTKKDKTVTVVHKTSGKELVVVDTPSTRKKYKRMDYYVQADPRKIKKAVRIAKKMSGDMTGAIKKIERIEKDLSNNHDVAYALKDANESVDEGFGGQLKGKKLKEFEKARKKSAEVLGYKLTGTSDINESVNEAKENPIDAARRIVKNRQSEKVGGVLVDMQTANLIVQIYDKVNSSNKKKMEKTPMKKLGVLVWKVAKKARR